MAGYSLGAKSYVRGPVEFAAFVEAIRQLDYPLGPEQTSDHVPSGCASNKKTSLSYKLPNYPRRATMTRAHTVLIADDDLDLLEVLSTRCRGLGLHVRTADNSLDLLNTMHDDPPGLACVDVQMPCGTGLSACEILAADPEFSSIPVIVMSGGCNSDTIRRCWRLNAHYVLKSADTWAKLEPLIRKMLNLPAKGAVV